MPCSKSAHSRTTTTVREKDTKDGEREEKSREKRREERREGDLGHGIEALVGGVLVRLGLLLLEGELGVVSECLVKPLSQLRHLLVDRHHQRLVVGFLLAQLLLDFLDLPQEKCFSLFPLELGLLELFEGRGGTLELLLVLSESRVEVKDLLLQLLNL